MIPLRTRTQLGRARRALQRRRAPSAADNVAYNRHFWDRYARDWRNPVLRKLGAGPARRDGEAALLGQEWGTDEDVEAILEEFLFPYLTPETIAVELGSGGGRIAAQVVDRVHELHCLDISPRMLAMARDALAGHTNARFTLLEGGGFPHDLAGKVDVLYSFDVWVHLDLHTMWRYLEDLPRVLRPGGKAFLHTSNVTAPEGWARFAGQRDFSVEGHYFISPEMVHTMLKHTPLQVIKASEPSTGNFYLNRDYLFVVENPG
jgi:SAM-dependent methyltransferase